jgi:adenylate kinase family enzyme
VVGCSGAGKTTLARSLAESLGCPHVELDAIFHQPGWTELDNETFRSEVGKAVAGPMWVVDGNYSVVQDIVWNRADTVVWVDLPYLLVMGRVILRTLRRIILRTELWNGNREPFTNLLSLDPQKSIIAWTATRHRIYHERYLAAEADSLWSGLTFIRLRSRSDVRRLQHASSPHHTRQGAA